MPLVSILKRSFMSREATRSTMAAFASGDEAEKMREP